MIDKSGHECWISKGLCFRMLHSRVTMPQFKSWPRSGSQPRSSEKSHLNGCLLDKCKVASTGWLLRLSFLRRSRSIAIDVVRSSNPFGNSRTIIGVVQVTSTASVRGGKFTSLLYFNLRLCKEECKRFTGVYDTAYMR